MEELKLGDTFCYPGDMGFFHFMDIPEGIAVRWAAEKFPDSDMGRNIKAKDIDCSNIKNEWMNKLLIVIANRHGKWIGLYNHDGIFSIQIKD